MKLSVILPDTHPLIAVAVEGHERLGEEPRFEVTVLSKAALDVPALVGKSCELSFAGELAARRFLGVVTSAASIATAQAADARHVKLVVHGGGFRLTLRRRTKVFQHATVAKILQEVFEEAGFDPKDLDVTRAGSLEEREYVVQYAETDAAFVRRLCEEEGLYLRHETHDDEPRYVLEGKSSTAPKSPVGRLPHTDDHGLSGGKDVVWAASMDRTFRAGRSTVRGFDPDHPAALHEGKASGGTPREQAFERYRAPARLTTPGKEKDRAQRLLEAARVDASVMRCRSSAFALQPGHQVELHDTPGHHGALKLEGDWLVVGLTHRWHRDQGPYHFEVEAIPLAVPFRLQLVTPRPKLFGVHTAIVTGAPGEEIHVDGKGRIKVRFPWDRVGPGDDKSSLPVRVAQQNTPGSLMIPRVGWEVMVAFEDGDADRPIVVGRTYNGKELPPYALPANKTMTAMGTRSSPGGKTKNVVSFDDAKGRQHLLFDAGYDFLATIANDLTRCVLKNEHHTVEGDQSWTVGKSKFVNVQDVVELTVDSHLMMVGGLQKLDVKGASKIGLKNEVVVIGGALLEKVGDPLVGLKNFAIAALLAAPGAIGSVLGKEWLDKVGALAKLAYAGYQFYQAKASGKDDHGMSNASFGVAVGGSILELFEIPGGEGMGQLVDQLAEAHAESAEEAEEAEKEHAEEEHEKQEAESKGKEGAKEDAPKEGGSAEGGGGSEVGAKKGGEAEAGGAGKRDLGVKGAMIEIIGAAHAIATPGGISWSTFGGQVIDVGASHVTKTLKYGHSVGGPLKITAASTSIDAKVDIKREIAGAVTTTISGALTREASGEIEIKAEANKIEMIVDGKLTIEGKTVFECGQSTVTISPDGLTIVSPTIVYEKPVANTAQATAK